MNDSSTNRDGANWDEIEVVRMRNSIHKRKLITMKIDTLATPTINSVERTPLHIPAEFETSIYLREWP